MDLETYTLYLYAKLLGIAVLIFISIRLSKKLKNYLRWKKISKKRLSSQQIDFMRKNFIPYQYLTEKERQRLHQKILYFLHYKNFFAIQDFSIDQNTKLIIAAQACLLIVNLDVEVFPKLSSIYVSAIPFIEKENTVSLQTMLPAHVPRLGESWKGGPVVLSWSSVEQGLKNWHDGHNLILHEFAHQLDALDGYMDGLPEIKDDSYKKWEILMSAEFKDLRKKVKKQQKTNIDPYGASNPAEFFAVTVEEFFSKARRMKKNHLELYNLYKSYFDLDPILWS